ncbi:protoheme IX farnesyltransferase PWA37_000812 [Arxiozyma heterogenica]|uniref:protoheme IX farnesyltransferase n=1 Tax=Arxiozyma heterogenica TaxID=278026 RepID=UPI002EFBE196
MIQRCGYIYYRSNILLFRTNWHRLRNFHRCRIVSNKTGLKDLSINSIFIQNHQEDLYANTAEINFTPNIICAKKINRSKSTTANTDDSSQHNSKHNLEEFALSLRCTDSSNKETQLNSIKTTETISNKTTTNTTNYDSIHTTDLPFDIKFVDKTTCTRQSITDKYKEIQLLKKGPITFPMLKKYYITPYIQLSKPRLTILVMLSAICSYALSPNAASILQLLSLTVGTTLCSSSANAINMGRELEFDRQMIRTQARPVVRGLISQREAYLFATVMGVLGVSSLYYGVNSTVALLGGLNIPLYSWIYTSLKRKYIINTWVGAIVGAIPPLMGWCAASSLTDPAAWILAGLLYAWQFPHFNALSHSIRNQYKNAGYVMTAWKNPKLNARVCLRYSLLMFPLCFALVYYDITDPYYAIDSSLANLWLTYWSFKFYWQQRYNYSKGILKDKIKFNEGMNLANLYARKTMLASVLQLPAVFILAILHKKGRWDWIFNKNQLALKP